MINFFGKKNELKVPNNLPELAKDSIEGNTQKILDEQSFKGGVENKIDKNLVNKELINTEPNKDFSVEKNYREIMPSSSNVPKFDIAVLKDRLSNASENYDINKDNIKLNNTSALNNTSIKISDREVKYGVFNSEKNISIGNRLSIKENNLVDNNVFSSNKFNNSYFSSNTLTEYLERAIYNKDFELLSEILNNFDKYLYKIYGLERDKDFNRMISELKNLEYLWVLLQEKSKSINNVISIIESDMINISKEAVKKILEDNNPKKDDLLDNVNSEKNFQESSLHYSLDVSKNDLQSVPIISPNERFYFNNGMVASNLKELYDILISIPDDVFYYHVNSEKNDFANWIRDVLKDYPLFDKIYGFKTKPEILNVLKDSLKN